LSAGFDFVVTHVLSLPRRYGSWRSRTSLAGTGCWCWFVRGRQHRQRNGLAGRLAPLALEAALDLDRALPVVVVELLAVQAGNALVGVDVPLGVDRLHRALLEAAHARVAAFA